MLDSNDEFDDYIGTIFDSGVIATRTLVQKRYIRDVYDPLTFYNDEEFRIRFRFRKETVVQVLLPLVTDCLNKHTRRGLPIVPVIQLLLSLRFYATGNYQVGR